jgi:hypothetical protein
MASEISHRELMVNRDGARPRYRFLELPQLLQDELIAGLDSNSLTLEEAEKRAKAAGYQIAHSSICRYYQGLRRERRGLIVRAAMERLREP